MRTQRKNIVLLYFSLVVILLGFGVLIPLEPFLVDAFGASGQALGALVAIYAITQLIFSPLWGGLSDQYGRKPLLVLGALGNAIALIMFGVASQLWMLFLARFLTGLFAAATLPTSMAYISDSTSEEERGRGMGIIGAAMGTGMVLGPGIGGWLGNTSLSLPFFVAAGLSLLAAVLILLILPESLGADKRVERAKFNPVSQFANMWRALWGPIGSLLFLAFLVSLGLTNFEGIFGLYALYRFDFGPKQVGTILMFIGIIAAVVQLVLTGPATKRWGEAKVIKMALLGDSIGFLLMLTAFNMTTVLLTAGFFVFANAMIRPAISSLISKRTDVKQGLALGLNNSFMSLGRFAGPLLAGFLFDINISLPYLNGAAITFLGFLLVLFLLRKD
jgi:DHA1 family multidrug resistance protein-like MFS transporter